MKQEQKEKYVYGWKDPRKLTREELFESAFHAGMKVFPMPLAFWSENGKP